MKRSVPLKEEFSRDFLFQILTYIDHFARKADPLAALNQFFKDRTKIAIFFEDIQAVEDFRAFIFSLLEKGLVQFKNQDERGDFQTNSDLTDRICQYLYQLGHRPTILMEPTCGRGNFILSALKTFPTLRLVYAVELSPSYEWLFKLLLLQLADRQQFVPNIEFHRDSIFTHDFSGLIQTRFSLKSSIKQELLILGNPPWVTNAKLGVLNSSNLPKKSNFKQMKGLESMTGKSNFDLAEYIIVDLLQKFSAQGVAGNLAMLCKNSVVRNILKSNHKEKLGLRLEKMTALGINAKKEFGISAAASLFICRFGVIADEFCKVTALDSPKSSPFPKFGWIDDKFVANIEDYSQQQYLDGACPFEWRQGVKTDLAKIMTLSYPGIPSGGNTRIYTNGNKDEIEIETDLVFPLLKSSDLQNPIMADPRKSIIITQKKIGEPTDHIEQSSPNLWAYLTESRAAFEKRKSRIYNNAPDFAIFGIGKYSFAPYKVAISGFYKTPNFCLLSSLGEKPIMLDDTCYLIPFDNLNSAVYSWLLLNSEPVQLFLKSLVFLDGKRPYTKEILMRIDLKHLAQNSSFQFIMDLYNGLGRKIDKFVPEAESFLQFQNSLK